MSLQLRQVLFRGRERAITLDWEVADGALCTIVAGPATGKTGAALSIVGASEPHCGVRIDERDVVTSHERARVLALVPSDPYLAFSLVGDSVRDEIALGFRFLGLTEDRGLIDTLTADLAIEHLLDRDPMSLSGGEAVRVALMLALIKRPRVIVLDDIWDSVDPHAEAGVRRFLSTWCGTSRGIVLDLRRESHRDVEGPILSIEPTTAAPLEEVNPTTFARELIGFSLRAVSRQ
jgi:energy-coupling factor transporter ATP-binding protein EcfA2